MSRRLHVTIAILAATTVTTGVIAWRQSNELTELRARSLDRSERAQLQKQVWDLQKTNRELQSRATPPGNERTETKTGATASAPRAAENNNRASAQQQLAFVRDLAARPEIQAYVASQQRSRLESSYLALFRNLGLNQEQSERLTGLLLERQNLRGEVAEAARSQGIDPRENPEGMRRLLAAAREELETSIKGVIGPAGFAALQSYDATLLQRGVVGDLQQRLGNTGAPLAATQAEQLVQILANNPVPRPNTAASPLAAAGTDAANPTFRGPDLGPVLAGLVGGGSGPAIAASIFAPMPGGGAIISDAALVQAQAVLSPPQVSALKDLQRQQQAQQQVQQIVRESLSSANRAGSTPTVSPPPAPRR
jgi:hypothetical protein